MTSSAVLIPKLHIHEHFCIIEHHCGMETGNASSLYMYRIWDLIPETGSYSVGTLYHIRPSLLYTYYIIITSLTWYHPDFSLSKLRCRHEHESPHHHTLPTVTTLTLLHHKPPTQGGRVFAQDGSLPQAITQRQDRILGR